jgi:restriction system protein
MKKYIRLMLGAKSMHAAECLLGNFVGADCEIPEDLTGRLPEDWRSFNKAMIPVFLKGHPGKSKISAGLACGMLWTVSKGLSIADIVLCPDGTGMYHVGEITSNYKYVPGGILPHRRAVRWTGQSIARSSMSEALQNSTGSIGTVCEISPYANEIESLLGMSPVPMIQSSNPEIEDPYAFAMEKHLEDFLVANWGGTDLGKHYTIYEEDGEKVGQQYLTDSGPIDILAISKDKKHLLVVELKRGRANDVVVGQILRYMGFVKDELLEPGQNVRGVIIALEDDTRLRRAISIVPSVEFYRYQVSFKLVK